MTKIEEIINRLKEENKVSSCAEQDFQNFIFNFERIIERLENKKPLKKGEKEEVSNILRLFHSLYIYE